MTLFGQKTDSIILAFTQTYYQGLSKLTPLCENVSCGEHFLCSVAANGHKNIAKPFRFGIRNGALVNCNRQLLISNAFEELIAERLPCIHLFIRRHYNKVGNQIHKYYYIFKIKLVSDIIYILMKPLEWLFIFTLYLFDSTPENRIAIQYINEEARKAIKTPLRITLRNPFAQ